MIIIFVLYRDWQDIHYECIKCLKAIMNTMVGLRYIFEHKDALLMVVQSIDTRFPSVMKVHNFSSVDSRPLCAIQLFYLPRRNCPSTCCS